MRESSAAFKLPSNDEVPEFKELPANEDFELPAAANDNFEVVQETPLEVDNERIDDVRERLGIRTSEVPDIEAVANDNNEGVVVLAENPGGATPEGPQDGGGNDRNNGGEPPASGGTGAPPPPRNNVERAKQVFTKQGHNVDWMNKWPGKGVIYFLGFIILPIWDFIKNTKFGTIGNELSKFGIKVGGGGGGGSAPKGPAAGGGAHH